MGVLTLSTSRCENRIVKHPRAYHHGNLRATLIDLGLKLIEEKGIPGLTLRDMGARAGVSRTAAYRHFASKAELLDAICDLGFTQFADARRSTASTRATSSSTPNGFVT